MKRILCMLICVLFAFMVCFTGCVYDDKTSEVDPSTPVLTMGNRTVTYSLYKALYDSYLPYFQYQSYDPLANYDTLHSFQDWILDILAQDVVVLHQAEQNGYVLNEDQEAELEKKIEKSIQELYDEYYGYAEEDYAEDSSIPVEVYFENYINQVSEYYTGVAMSWEDYSTEYAEEERRAFIVSEYKEYICEEFEPTTSDVTSWYDTQYSADKTTYTDKPGQFKVDQEYYEKYFGLNDNARPITYTPGGYSRIMHILVTPEGELSEEYTQKTERMEELRLEFNDLAFEDALNDTDANAMRIIEILDEYRSLKAETETEYASYSAAAIEKINRAYAELEAGQSFTEVMMDYTEDPLLVGDDEYDGCETFREIGQLISLDYVSSNDWSDTVKEKFAGLSLGEYSEVFFDDGSFHIIYYASDVEKGDVPLSDIYNDVLIMCADDAKEAQWLELVEEWLNDPELIKNEELIRSLGAKDVKDKGDDDDEA